MPGLVAGAWVGFNDPRVTIRSNHWGQGGHNALRIVGSFYRQGQKARLIETKAEFPQVEPDVRDVRDAAAGGVSLVSAVLQGAASSLGAGLSRLFGSSARAAPRSPEAIAEAAARKELEDLLRGR